VVAALEEGFRQVAGGKWNSTGLTSREERLADLLCHEKYARPSWTFRAEVAPNLAQDIENVLL
jgi:lipoate-protein ligase A